ncbi:Uncharacterized protein APZ42_000464 [Daphnia magna]|uniref:Uncharacterized protein n=1 Tax=Daphnia magna TaxID=35525 RepID=A0A0P6AAA8_9CRUS|nr:Uncharacterized protein APZ42_000464 [Daphnia magna]
MAVQIQMANGSADADGKCQMADRQCILGFFYSDLATSLVIRLKSATSIVKAAWVTTNHLPLPGFIKSFITLICLFVILWPMTNQQRNGLSHVNFTNFYIVHLVDYRKHLAIHTNAFV